MGSLLRKMRLLSAIFISGKVDAAAVEDDNYDYDDIDIDDDYANSDGGGGVNDDVGVYETIDLPGESKERMQGSTGAILNQQ